MKAEFGDNVTASQYMVLTNKVWSESKDKRATPQRSNLSITRSVSARNIDTLSMKQVRVLSINL